MRSEVVEYDCIHCYGSTTSLLTLFFSPSPRSIYLSPRSYLTMASRGTKDSQAKGPGNIDIGSSVSSSSSQQHTDGKTPTQEMHRFNIDGGNPNSLSKRRGSDSLSIGTPSTNDMTSAPSGSENPVLPRTSGSSKQTTNLSAVASVNAANAVAAAGGKSMDTPNALGLKRPSASPIAGSKATAVSDEDDNDDNNSDTISDTTSAGDQGDDEGDSSKNPTSGNNTDGTATPQQPPPPPSNTQQYHQQQQQQHHHHHYNNQQNHSQSYMNIPAHERGRTHNGHDLELSGTQPMRPRQHQRTSTTSSIAFFIPQRTRSHASFPYSWNENSKWPS